MPIHAECAQGVGERPRRLIKELGYLDRKDARRVVRYGTLKENESRTRREWFTDVVRVRESTVSYSLSWSVAAGSVRVARENQSLPFSL
jgi:hypothetical protein